jgi:hypothetical protein
MCKTLCKSGGRYHLRYMGCAGVVGVGVWLFKRAKRASLFISLDQFNVFGVLPSERSERGACKKNPAGLGRVARESARPISRL